MSKQKPPNLLSQINTAVPDRRLIKLTDEQVASLKKASDIALAVIGTAGVIVVSAVAPNLFKAMASFSGKRHSSRSLTRKAKIKKVGDTFYYLKRSGLVRFRASGKEWLLSLTDPGRKRFSKIEFESIGVPKPSRWDSHWWLVAADIPTRDHRAGADLLRKKLKRLGFYPLQRTLWVYPYDPRKTVEVLCQHYGIAQFVTVMEVLRLDREDEKLLQGHFGETGVL